MNISSIELQSTTGHNLGTGFSLSESLFFFFFGPSLLGVYLNIRLKDKESGGNGTKEIPMGV